MSSLSQIEISPLENADNDLENGTTLGLARDGVFASPDLAIRLFEMGFHEWDSSDKIAKQDALGWAISNHHTELVQLILDDNFDVNSSYEGDWTFLTHATKSSTYEIIDVLLKAGATVNAKMAGGITALHIATQIGSQEVVQLLLSNGASVHAQCDTGSFPLHNAAENGHVEVIRILLDANADIDAKDENGETPLTTLVKRNAVEIASLLLQRGANSEAFTSDGDGLLHVAVWLNSPDMIQLLVEHGANIEAKDTSGRTLLLNAARQGKPDIARYLTDHGANVMATSDRGSTVIHYAAFSKNRPLIRLFVRHGVPVDARAQPWGETALMRAVSQGNVDVVSLLIEQGANVDAAGPGGQTPLHYAAANSQEQIVKILLERNANPIAKADDGRYPYQVSTGPARENIMILLDEKNSAKKAAVRKPEDWSVGALMLAAESGHLARGIQILDEGTHVNSLNMDSRTALSLSAERGHTNFVLALIERGADIGLADADGASPLWWASRYGHETVVKHLLDHGASADSPDLNGQSPLSVASQCGRLAAVKLLLEHGANPNSATRYKTTPLLFAEAHGHHATAELLLQLGADISYRDSQEDPVGSLAKVSDHEDLTDSVEPTSMGHTSISTASTGGVDQESTYDSNTGFAATTGPGYPAFTGNGRKAIKQRYSSRLIDAAKEGRLAEIERLARAGITLEGYEDLLPPLHTAAYYGQTDAAKALISCGVDIDHRNEHGHTALNVAAQEGNESIVHLLHKHGASLELRDDGGATPLLKAAYQGHREATSALLQLGASIEAKDHCGETPLWWAAYSGQMAVAELLLTHGANIDSTDINGYTPLIVAIMNRHAPVTRVLLEHGAQMKPDSFKGYSPLCWAAYNGDEVIVGLLIDYGSNVDYPSDGKRTALHIAAFQGHGMVTKMLIEAGADFGLEDSDGRTALSLAKEESEDSTIQVLCCARSLYKISQESKRKDLQLEFGQRGIYRQLSTPDSIRVLELYPGSPGDILRFDLYEVQLSMNPSFEALSYEWLAKVGTVPVECNDERLLITPNCKAALEILRYKSKPRYLWIDAICINQADHLERNQQVALMRDVYRAARTVLMWLGEEAKHTRAVFGAISEMEKSGHVALNDEEVSEGLKDLIDRTYWTRAWILQETILAGSRGFCICGSYGCLWTTLKVALMAYWGETTDKAPVFTTIQLDDVFSMTSGELSLYEATYPLISLNATDPRDKVFASLGLVSTERSSIERPVADYTMTVQQVYIKATRYLIHESGIEDTWRLGIRQSTKTIHGLPSWVPDFRFEVDRLQQPDHLVCSGDLQLSILEKPVTTQSSLRISGCILDKVIFKLTLTKEFDIYKILFSVVQLLAKHGRSIYDPYRLGIEAGASFDMSNAPTLKIDEDSIPLDTNAAILFATIMESELWSPEFDPSIVSSAYEHLTDRLSEGGDSLTPTQLYQMAIGYLNWSLSQDDKAQEQPSQVPGYAQRASDELASMDNHNKDAGDFTLRSLEMMEDMLRYDQDLIYTEKGYFGFTHGGEAEKGMLIAQIGELDDLCLLRKGKGDEEYYEYTDRVFLSFLPSQAETIGEEATVQDLELR